LGTAATVVLWGRVSSPLIEFETDTQRAEDSGRELASDLGAKDSVVGEKRRPRPITAGTRDKQ